MTTPYEALRGVLNATEFLPTLVAGGQPDLKHLEAFKAAGGTAVIDVRAPSELRAFDEPGAARTLGLAYTQVTVGPTPLTDELMERVLAALRRHPGENVFLHCASGNRTGGPMIAHLILDHGFEEEDAVQLATRGGLRSPEILAWGLDYARRHHRP
jgi:protein tyrosine phosphatase (PTP) superfamily phosphohydrolase (DUF442 family)